MTILEGALFEFILNLNDVISRGAEPICAIRVLPEDFN